MIKKNRILVTGVNGYVGSHIFNYFAKKSDYVVEGIDIIEKASDSRIHIVDLRKANTTKIFFRDNKFDFIYHTAGIIEGQNISEYINGNVTTTLNLLDSLKEDKDVRIFIFGTASQYSNKYVRLVKETDKTLPVNNYGLSNKSELKKLSFPHWESISILKARDKNTGLLSLHSNTNINSENVKLITLDSYFENQNIKGNVYIKIDVEGHEFQVLQGSQQFLTRDLNIILELELNFKINDKIKNNNIENSIKFLKNFNYEPIIVSNSQIKLLSEDKLQDVITNKISMDLYFRKKIKW